MHTTSVILAVLCNIIAVAMLFDRYLTREVKPIKVAWVSASLIQVGLIQAIYDSNTSSVAFSDREIGVVFGCQAVATVAVIVRSNLLRYATPVSA